MKITVLKNGVKNQDAFDHGIAKVVSMGKAMGFNFDISVKTIDYNFSSIPFTNSSVISGHCVDPTQILSQVTGEEDITCLVYDWSKVSPQPTNPVQSPVKKIHCTPIQIPEQWYNGYEDVFVQYFLHEICHAMYFLLDRIPQDMTHLLTSMNLDPVEYMKWANKQPSDYYLNLIQKLTPAWNLYKSTQQMKTITLTRTLDTGIESLGDLITDGFACKTLERPWLNNQKNISCIPKGVYTVKYTFSPRLLRYTYEVQNVPNRSGIRIHSGNYFFDTDGCILLGTGYQDINSDKKTDVISSKVTITKFEALLNKQDFTLIVK